MQAGLKNLILVMYRDANCIGILFWAVVIGMALKATSKAVSTSGLEIFKTYGQLVLVLVCTMLIVAFGTNAVITGLVLKKNPYPPLG